MLANQLGTSATSLPGLAEHRRRSTTFVGKVEFEAAIHDLFRRPGEIVFGDEGADVTVARFASALDDAMSAHGNDTVLAVSGGTAICLYIAKRQGTEAFPLWQTLKMPMAFVIDRTTWEILAIH